MSVFSLCMISSILRGLPHWPLLAGLLIPDFGTRASNDVSQILATTQLDRFVAPEPPPVEFDLNRPQGQLKSVLFVVVRDKGHFPIENIQITVGTIGGNEATQQADEGWAAFELGRNGPYHGSLHVTVSDPSASLTVEDLEGASVDLALLVDESQPDLRPMKFAEDKQERQTPAPLFVHRWRLNVIGASLTSPLAACSGPVSIQLGHAYSPAFRGFLDVPGGCLSFAGYMEPTASFGAQEVFLFAPYAGRLFVTPLQLGGADAASGSFRRCQEQLLELQFLPRVPPRHSPSSVILFDHLAAGHGLSSLAYISRGAGLAETTVFQFWCSGLGHID